jgi:uncharacterized membrane protein SirB2
MRFLLNRQKMKYHMKDKKVLNSKKIISPFLGMTMLIFSGLSLFAAKKPDAKSIYLQEMSSEDTIVKY